MISKREKNEEEMNTTSMLRKYINNSAMVIIFKKDEWNVLYVDDHFADFMLYAYIQEELTVSIDVFFK